MRFFIMFVTAVCVLFLLKLKWPKNKSFYDSAVKNLPYTTATSIMPTFSDKLCLNFFPLPEGTGNSATRVFANGTILYTYSPFYLPAFLRTNTIRLVVKHT